MDIIKYGFALFGLTKAGKTTLAHLLVKNSLVGKEKATG
jgi:type IV secretory pathway VirB4 component